MAKSLNHHPSRLTLDGWAESMMGDVMGPDAESSTFGHGAYFQNSISKRINCYLSLIRDELNRTDYYLQWLISFIFYTLFIKIQL